MIVKDKHRPNLLLESWARCEEVVRAIGLRTVSDSYRKLGTATVEKILGFLKEIGFVEDTRLTELGSSFFRANFLLNDEKTASEILAAAVKQYEPTQAICQLFWGRRGLKKANVFELLVFEEYLDKRLLSEEDIGSFLMLLNQCNVIKYSKKSGDIAVVFNPRTGSPGLSPSPTRFLSPETPYSNLRNLWDVLRSCKGFIHWFEKSFPAKGLEPLHDEADGTRITEIKILAGVDVQYERLRRDFERFRSEMRIRGISCELRVIRDKQLLNSIHDRWIVSEGLCYNVPPVNSMFMGQYSELKQTSNRPPFASWWEKGLDLIDGWQDISKNLVSTVLTQ